MYFLLLLSIFCCLSVYCYDSKKHKSTTKNFATNLNGISYIPSFQHRQQHDFTTTDVKNFSKITTVTTTPRYNFSFYSIIQPVSTKKRFPFNNFNQDQVPLVRLTRDILAPNRYDIRVRPVLNHTQTLKIYISMSCKFLFFLTLIFIQNFFIVYQIIEVNEPAQYVKMNVWMIQKWHDESLDWNPYNYAMINTTILPHNVLWIPDTYLYNS